MKTFMVGLGVGFGLGVLFAPMRGEDLREIAAVRASEIADTARERYGQARDVAAKGIDTIRNAGAEVSTGTQGKLK